MSDRFVILSGCSGGGKSTLLAELRARGFATVEEPGRRIVREELARGGTALPWVDLAAFALRAIEMSLADREAVADPSDWVFFDRSLVDAASALASARSEPISSLCRIHRYHKEVFLTPPWPEIYEADLERQGGFAAATEEYQRLLHTYADLGYRVTVLPQVSVPERADFLVSALA